MCDPAGAGRRIFRPVLTYRVLRLVSVVALMTGLPSWLQPAVAFAQQGGAAVRPFLPPALVETPEMVAARHVYAFALAFPDRVAEVAFRDGDWALRIDDSWYYYAHGRFLPYHLRGQWQEYTGVRFYRYERGPLILPELTPERIEQLRGTRERQNANPAVRHPEFLDRLYEMKSAVDARRMVVEVRFLGLRTEVHRVMVEPLERVERRIESAATQDPRVRSFVQSLASIEGQNWRSIAGTASRSYHSYGLALDLLPRSFGRQAVYWRWTEDAGVTEWWAVPIERRWIPPQQVIDAFEAEGFIWGGKWLYFDSMHFEYRPEVFIADMWTR